MYATHNKVAFTAYLSFLAVTLLPTILQELIPQEERMFVSMFLGALLLWLVAPTVQVLGIVAQWVQARETRSRGETGALSVQGLVVQAVVFLLVGFSFVYRLALRGEPEDFDEHFIVNLRDWYWLLGWATINNVIFGLGQGRLAWIASRQRGGDGQGEQDPLLA